MLLWGIEFIRKVDCRRGRPAQSEHFARVVTCSVIIALE